ncbi:uncharacterized protein LOC144702782 isoform X2 [Wolffia australiana]
MRERERVGHPTMEGEARSMGDGRKQKPRLRLAVDDTKPVLRDPILRSYPIETEQAVLRLPPLPEALMSETASSRMNLR